MPLPAGDLSEVWKGIRTALLTDTDLTGLLGTTDNIIRVWPRTKLTYPLIEMVVRNYEPDTELTGIGKYQPSLQLNIYAAHPDTIDQILNVLQHNWSIPLTRAASITTTHFRIDRLDWMDPIPVGPVRLLNDETDVLQLSIEANLRVVRTSV